MFKKHAKESRMNAEQKIVDYLDNTYPHGDWLLMMLLHY